MRTLKTLLILIIVIRVGFSFLPALDIDMSGWKAWSARLAQTGPSNFYAKDYFSDYFPGYLYILWFAGSLFNFVSFPIYSLSFEVFLKSITLLFDIGSAIVIYKLVSSNKRRAYFVPLLYLLNPAIIFNSSVWGQVDGIFTFFTLLSFYFFLEQKKLFKSVTSMTLGFLVKPLGVAVIPAILINGFKTFSLDKIAKGIVLGLLFLVISSLPFFPNNPVFGLLELAKGSQNVYQYTSLFAFNFWGVIGTWKPDNAIFIVSYKTWGMILFLISMFLISFPLLGKKIEKEQIYFASALSVFSFFIFLTRMHERYLFLFLPLLLVTSLIQKKKILLYFYLLISFLHFINLWFVYYYYNFVYTSSYSKNIFLEKLYPLYVFTNNNFKLFSVSMVILFGVLLFYYVKLYAKK